MSKHKWKRSISVVGRMLLAYALIFMQSALAVQNSKTKDKTSSPQQTSARTEEKQSSAATNAKASAEEAQGEASEAAVAAEKPSSDASHQGIKVHGHWTIEVRNPDGTVATHREFENSLVATGAAFLGSILGRTNTVGGWELDLSSTTVPPCVTISAAAADCIIYESGAGYTSGGNLFTSLGVSVGAAGSLILSGTAMAGQNGTIDKVVSYDYFCGPSAAPAACLSHEIGRYFFTSAALSPAVNVSLGQTVAVTVTFTFS